MQARIYIFLALIAFGWYGCNLEKEVELDLPEYERELVVECWLEPGKPYRLTLSESVGYFDDIDLPLIQSAEVYIIHANDSVRLFPIPAIDEGRFYTFTASRNVPADYNSDFELYIRDDIGREIRGRTQVLPPVPMDTLEYEFNDVDSALVRVRFQDPSGGDNYYIWVLHENSLSENREFAFNIQDRNADGEMIVLSSLYFRQRGDTAIATLYHITQDVFDYLESSDAAASANGNPFAPPTRVLSNVEGGIGIFAGYAFDRDSVIIQ